MNWWLWGGIGLMVVGFLAVGRGTYRLELWGECEKGLSVWTWIKYSLASILGVVVASIGIACAINVVALSNRSFHETGLVTKMKTVDDGSVLLIVDRKATVPCESSTLCQTAHIGDVVRYTVHYNAHGWYDYTTFIDLAAFHRH